MSQLTVTALQLGLLALLWVFVIAVIGVLRRDLFGPRVLPRTAAGTGRVPRRAPRPAPAPPAAGPTTPATPATPAAPPDRPAPHSPAPATPPSSAAPAAARSLVVTEGPLAGTQLPLGPSPVLIGRGPDCTLVLPDDYASSHHARLVPGEDGWFLEDLGSTNGTQLGRGPGAPQVSGRVPVSAGSTIRIGRTVLELRR